jgi:hypothetical protein
MAETQDPNEATAVRKEPFQFSIRQMLVLTAVSAMAAALASSMHASAVFKCIVAFYLILLAAYVVLRLPYVWRGIVRKTPAWDRFRRHRSELEAMALKMKRETERNSRGANS